MANQTKARITSLDPQVLVDDLERSIAYYRRLGFAQESGRAPVSSGRRTPRCLGGRPDSFRLSTALRTGWRRSTDRSR